MQTPQRWNIDAIRNFMLVIGPISSAYDFLTFFILLKVFGAAETLFPTGWFVESLAATYLVLVEIVKRRLTGRLMVGGKDARG